MKKSKHEMKVIKNCDVCKLIIIVDGFGIGTCSRCGWHNVDHNVEHPDEWCWTNIVSLNRARKLWKEGKKFKANFEEFLHGVEVFGHMEFYYKKRHYGVLREVNSIDFYEWDIVEGFQSYQTIEEFAEKAHIGGKFLREIWDEVENAGFM